MGKYLNPGKAAFSQAIRSDVFVDKTQMIRYLNSVVGTQQKYMSVSRPRRFGKTMAIGMICAYYSHGTDSHELFKRCELAETAPVLVGGEKVAWDAYLGAFDVVRVVMTDFFKRDANTSEAIVRLQRLVCRDIQRQYPNVDYLDSEDLIQTMEDVYYHTGRRFMVEVAECRLGAVAYDGQNAGHIRPGDGLGGKGEVLKKEAQEEDPVLLGGL